MVAVIRICPTCDAPAAERSNAAQDVTLRVPEAMVPVLAGILRQASVRAGMHGYGITANMLTDLARPLHEGMPEALRGFLFSPEAFSQAIHAHDLGYDITAVVDPKSDRQVHVVGVLDGKRRVLAGCFLREGEDPLRLCDAIEDVFARRTRAEPVEGGPQPD